MIGTGWVIIDGIIAMEPDSKARNSKIYQNLILLVLEGFVFSLAGQYKKYAFWLRAFGWGVFALQIVLMTLANYSIGATAGKAAELKQATVTEIIEQAKADRKVADTLQDSADKLSKSKHGWLNSKGGDKATEAAQKTASAAGSADKLSKIEVSAPIIDKIGEGGLMALSGALAVITEFAGMLLMHYGGVLRNDALVDAVPVEYQILAALGTLQNALGVAVAPTLEALPAPAPALGQAAAPSFKPAGVTAPKDFSGLSYSTKATIAGASALAAMTAPTMTQAAPAVPAAAPVSPSDRGINDEGSKAAGGINVDTPPPSTMTPPPINDDTPTPVAAPVAKARKTAVREGLPMDSGTGPLDGFRYRRAVAGVQARTIRPSLAGLYAGVGVTAAVAHRFIDAMALAGEIVPNPDGPGWIPAPAKKAKKGGAK